MSIRVYRGKKGVSYQVRVEGEALEAGRRHQIAVGTFATRQEAELAELRARLAVREGTAPGRARKGSLGEVYRAWVERKRVLGRIGDATAARYLQILTVQLASLSHVPVSKLTSALITDCYKARRQAGDSGTCLANAHRRLKSCLQTLVEADELPRHPMRNLACPRAEPAHSTVWTLAEAERFFRAEVAHPYYPLWRFLVETGLRVGELRALRWCDVALGDTPRVTVGATITGKRDRDGRLHAIVADRTKTRERRSFPFSPALAGVLIAHKGAQRAELAALGLEWREEQFVFPNADRSGFASRNTIGRALSRACARAGVPRITPHGFRHTNASRAVAAGVPLPLVMERLGHKRLETTARYLHTAAAEHTAAATTIADLFTPGDDVSREKKENFLTEFLTQPDGDTRG